MQKYKSASNLPSIYCLVFALFTDRLFDCLNLCQLRWQIVFLNICHEVYEIRTKFTTKVSATLAEKKGVN